MNLVYVDKYFCRRMWSTHQMNRLFKHCFVGRREGERKGWEANKQKQCTAPSLKYTLAISLPKRVLVLWLLASVISPSLGWRIRTYFTGAAVLRTWDLAVVSVVTLPNNDYCKEKKTSQAEWHFLSWKLRYWYLSVDASLMSMWDNCIKVHQRFRWLGLATV